MHDLVELSRMLSVKYAYDNSVFYVIAERNAGWSSHQQIAFGLLGIFPLRHWGANIKGVTTVADRQQEVCWRVQGNASCEKSRLT